MNCEACKFAKRVGTKFECTKNPKPFVKLENACIYFIKTRQK